MSIGIVSSHAVIGGGGSAYDTLMGTLSPTFYVKQDEVSGSTAVDSSGNGNDFTNTAATVGATKVRPNGVTAYDYNGTSSKMDRASVTNTYTFSLTAWIYPDTIGASRAIASRDRAGGGWALYIDTSGKLNAFFPGNGNAHLGTTALSATTAYFIGMTCDVAGNQTKLYINGALDATFAAVPAGSFQTFSFRIGNSRGSNTADATNLFFFDGRMDDISFHANTVLTGTNISDLYAAA